MEGRGNRLKRWQGRAEWKREHERETANFWLIISGCSTIERGPSQLPYSLYLPSVWLPFFFYFPSCQVTFKLLTWVGLPVVCSPNWSQDADALAAWAPCSISTHIIYLRLNQHGVGKMNRGSQCRRRGKRRCRDWIVGSGGLFIVAGTPPVQVNATFLLHFWKQLAFQEMVLEMPYHKMKYISASGTKQSLTNGLNKWESTFLCWGGNQLTLNNSS